MFPQFCACLTRAPELREPGPVPRLSGEIPAHGLAYRPDAILERSLNAREQPMIVMAGLTRPSMPRRHRMDARIKSGHDRLGCTVTE
jgi:hypothetical protein